MARDGQQRALANDALLRVDGLAVSFDGATRATQVLSGVGFHVGTHETVAIVGESGSGKSLTALSILGLLPGAARITAGEISFDGRTIASAGHSVGADVRGREIGMIFQDPMTSLNPILTVGEQIAEPMRAHLGLSHAQARARTAELMSKVGIPDPALRMGQYPHQFSGGMRQRVMIAIGLSCHPKLLIADEPTTALDVTIQAQILDLMRALADDLGVALLIITHNLGIVARYADRVLVMYGGRIVEQGSAYMIFNSPRHPYTAGLLRSVPRIDGDVTKRLNAIEGLPPDLRHPISGCSFVPRCPHAIPACAEATELAATDTGGLSSCVRATDMAMGRLPPPEAPAQSSERPRTADALIDVSGLSRHFALRLGWMQSETILKAVDDVSFSIAPGETLGLVGESGCGKSTVGRSLLRLIEPTGGQVLYRGRDVTNAPTAELKDLRRKLQIVFQDPYASLNPRKSIGEAIAEPLRVHGLTAGRKTTAARVSDLLDRVGLRRELATKYPHQLSGGQRQRVGIARALAVEPELIVCDEAVSALDVSVQAQIVNLLIDLQAQQGLSYLFIAHDLAVVRQISHRVMVMYLGRVVEMADRDQLFNDPRHPYTKVLLEAVPSPDPDRERAKPSPMTAGEATARGVATTGCAFAPRCAIAVEACRTAVPALRTLRAGHHVACTRV